MPEMAWAIVGFLVVLLFILWLRLGKISRQYYELKAQMESRAQELFEK
ncbi:hypothetical protein GQS_01920 [Thermococcus sp. 4557]|nr:hypothetical protein [Thermococcus sp. 4557]AEK72286.1 hypothetical protein GQS_01920 [Thermococcus sp. 4557]